ncbi:MAG: alpha/beta fold hydrolase [Myxococcota bacterium]
METKPAAWRRELDVLLLQSRLIATGLRRRPAVRTGPRVAVFVHGFLAAGPVFDPLREHVEETTGLPGVDFTYSPFASFAAIVHRLNRLVERTLPAGARVSLVGHSLGGLAARWYVQEMGGRARVDRLVTLATPHAGTEVARLLPLPLGQAIHPEGSVVQRLEQRAHLLADVPHTMVVAGRDRLIDPVESAAAAPQGRVVWLPDVGHNEILYDARSHRIVAGALE